MNQSFGRACLFAVAVAACVSLSPAASAARGSSGTPEARAAGRNACGQRANVTAAMLASCMTEASLWQHLSEFQQISDANPGPSGHGNRNTGSSGYKASVAYVAGLMRAAGYTVTIQPYEIQFAEVAGKPTFRSNDREYAFERDWFAARRSGSGNVTATVQPPAGTSDGCAAGDFAGFTRGSVALLERGACAFVAQVANARAAGARAVVLYNRPAALDAFGKGSHQGNAYQINLPAAAGIPVVGVASYAVGADLLRRYRSGTAPSVSIEIHTRPITVVDYNVIADSPYGDPNSVVVVDAHLDAIFGAGMLDNASGSTTILEIALDMAKTPTRNHLRYIWFGGEELGLLGSQYYTTHLTHAELSSIAFDIDADVTATPNFDILVADPANASNVNSFPANVVPQSKIGNAYFAAYFKKEGVVSLPASFGNDGTDSNSFSLVGIPNSGILTQQDCCKAAWETKIWGGFEGNYEGKIPSFDGGCVDLPHRWCDNLSNNDPFVLGLVSKSVGYVTFMLANHAF